MIEVDIVVIGSGVSALSALSIAKSLGKKAIAVDLVYLDGGYLQALDSDTHVHKTPVFIGSEDVGFFEKLGVDIVCLEPELVVIKKNSYLDKTLGFAGIDVQRNWFIEWVNSRKLCTSPDMFSKLKKALGFEKDRLIHIPSGPRKIDAEKKIIALASGELVKYKHIVYTWPLSTIHRYLRPADLAKKIKEHVEGLSLDYVSIYMLSAQLQNRDSQDKLRIYTHETKASRMHTAIALDLKKTSLVYAITSYSRRYPLLPGIYEKMLSEIRRFRISTPLAIAKGYGINIVYGLISKASTQALEHLKNTLDEIDIHLFGRLGQWRDQTVREILEDREIQQVIA